MKEVSEIKIPKGVDRIAVKQHEDKIVIEFIPEERKFKAGDKVKIKDGISSETHRDASPNFTEPMNKFIGKELTVEKYSYIKWVVFYEDDYGYQFSEDWLEPWNDEPKKGDLAIFWDYSKDIAIMRTYREKKGMLHYDSAGYPWKNSIKFESKDQYKKLLRGEI